MAWRTARAARLDVYPESYAAFEDGGIEYLRESAARRCPHLCVERRLYGRAQDCDALLIDEPCSELWASFYEAREMLELIYGLINPLACPATEARWSHLCEGLPCKGCGQLASVCMRHPALPCCPDCSCARVLCSAPSPLGAWRAGSRP